MEAVSRSVELYAASLLATAKLPDARLATRAVKFVAALAAHPGGSIAEACEDRHQAKAAYRFIENERVRVENVLPSLADASARNCAGHARILVIQDTTAFNFSALKATTGLGPIGDAGSSAQGIWCHTTLAATESGKPIGLLHQELWVRDPEQRHKAQQRRRLPIEQKESMRWLTGIRMAHGRVAECLGDKRPALIHIEDREADITEVFEDVRRLRDEAIIRCRHNRVTAHPLKRAFAAVRAAPCLGTRSVNVPRHAGHPARKARVELRACRLSLPAQTADEPPLELTLLEVWEPQPPADCEPLHWLLWTTFEAQTPEQAVQVVTWYTCRWRIEDVHLTLKSGYNVEELQFETAERLEKLITLITPLAIRIVNLRDAAREQPEASCTEVLSDPEWRTLQAYCNKQLPGPQEAPPTLRQAALWIGRLGGHMGRKGDGLPGVRTLWIGFRDLQRMTRLFQICRSFG